MGSVSKRRLNKIFYSAKNFKQWCKARGLDWKSEAKALGRRTS